MIYLEDPKIPAVGAARRAFPKLIPRTHNDYVYNSKMAAAVTGVGPAKILLTVLPLAHNLPLAVPGLQGYLLHGGKVVVANTTRMARIFFVLSTRHRVTHIAVVPALLIRLINDLSIKNFDLSSLQVIQSGGGQRLQPEIRRRTKELIPSVTVQENFGEWRRGCCCLSVWMIPKRCGWKLSEGPSAPTMRCGWWTTTIVKFRRARLVNYWPVVPTRSAGTPACRSTIPERSRLMAFIARGI